MSVITPASEPREAAGPTASSRLPQVVGMAALVIAVGVAFLPSEWSLVDDSALKTSLEGNVRSHGLAQGMWEAIRANAVADGTWGLFRPLWYVYAGTFYLAPPWLAHAIRMAMFLAAVTIPALAWARRRDGGWNVVFFGWAACLLLVNSHLYQGLSFLSLQELTGVFLVALGLAIRAPGWRGLCWLAAAWMKAPFAWLLIAYAVWLAVRRDTRWKGLALGAAGAGTVLLAAVASRRGTYTSGYTLSIERAVSSMQTALPLFGWVGVVAVLGLLLLRVDVRHLGWRDPLALVFTAGGLGYLVTLLPWGVQAYYGGPVVWMLSVAGIRLVATAPRREPSLRQPMTALLAALAVLAAGRIVWIMGGVQYDRNASVVGLRDWAVALPRSGVVIGVNGPEAALRLGEIMRLRDPRWDNEFVNIDDTDSTTTVDFYVQLEDQGAGNPRLTRDRVAALPRANVFAP